MKLSKRQRQVLAAIDRAVSITGPALAQELARDDVIKPTEQGIHATAASLVRHGLVTRLRAGGRVHYSTTEAGEAAAREYAS